MLGLHTCSCDFTNTILNADLREDVYINACPGTPELPLGYVYKLQKDFHGLKQSPREWNNTLNRFMTEDCEFKLSLTRQERCINACLYVC